MPTTPQPKKPSSSSDKSRPVSKGQLSEAQRREQQLLQKIKRLNTKLSKVKAISTQMNIISHKTNEVSSRQVEDWAKKITEVLNGDR